MVRRRKSFGELPKTWPGPLGEGGLRAPPGDAPAEQTLRGEGGVERGISPARCGVHIKRT